MLLLLNLLATFLHLLELFFEASLLLLAALLQLHLSFSKAGLFFNQGLDDHDFVLFDSALSDLVI